MVEASEVLLNIEMDSVALPGEPLIVLRIYSLLEKIFFFVSKKRNILLLGTHVGQGLTGHVLRLHTVEDFFTTTVQVFAEFIA